MNTKSSKKIHEIPEELREKIRFDEEQHRRRKKRRLEKNSWKEYLYMLLIVLVSISIVFF